MSICLGARAAPPVSSLVGNASSRRFNHVKCRPSPALAPFVDHYWVTRWDRGNQPPRIAASLLDPCVHVHVQDGRAEVTGVVRGLFRVRIEGTGCVVGVKFRPGGFYPFVRRPVTAWTDRVVPARVVFGDPAGHEAGWSQELTDAVAACRGDASDHASIATVRLDRFLTARLPARDGMAEDVARLVALIAATADVRRMSDLMLASGRSERTLHRLFARYVGVSPAWVIRRYRLQAAAERLMAAPRADVSALAWELGYADQAHFIRDFRATIGMTPGAYAQAHT